MSPWWLQLARVHCRIASAGSRSAGPGPRRPTIRARERERGGAMSGRARRRAQATRWRGGRRPHGPVPHPRLRGAVGHRPGRGGRFRSPIGAKQVAAHYDTQRAVAITASSIGRSTSRAWRCRPSNTSRSRATCSRPASSVLVEKPMTPDAGGGARALRGSPAQQRRAPRGPRRALQRRGAGAAQDRGAARSSSSRAGSGPFVPRVQNDTRGDGPDDPRHRHRAGPGRLAEPRRLTAIGVLGPLRRSTDVANVQIVFDSRRDGHHHRAAAPPRRRSARWPSRSRTPTSCSTTPSKTSSIYRRAAQEYTLNRESIRYRRRRSWSTCRFTRTILSSWRSAIWSRPRAAADGGREAWTLAETGRPALAGHGAGDRADDPRRPRRGRLAEADLPWSVLLPRPDGRRRRRCRRAWPAEARRDGAGASSRSPSTMRPALAEAWADGLLPVRASPTIQAVLAALAERIACRPPSSSASSGRSDLLDVDQADAAGLRSWPRGPASPTTALVRASCVATLAAMGIEVLDQRALPRRLAGARRLAGSSRAPTEAEWAEIRGGFAVARLVADDGGSARRWCARAA